MTDKKKLLVIVGPTAVGKTALSIELAKKFNGEIISGDSMQVYVGMDVGTAKISAEQMEGIPHHLIDVLEPTEPFSVAEFQSRAKQLIDEISARHKLPIIVGGTGLYVESVIYDYVMPDAHGDERIRAELQLQLEVHGAEAMHSQLALVDPEAAARLHPNDSRRMIRALEVMRLTGKPLSQQLSRKQLNQSPYDVVIIGLSLDRAQLYERIHRRIDQMIERGLVDEVQALRARYGEMSNVAMQAIGYKEVLRYLDGAYSFEHMVDLLQRDTRRYAKRQLSWFRHMDGIEWIDAQHDVEFQLNKICAILDRKFDIGGTTNE